MAEEGIDRKQDERLEFSTSKEVSVAPTFEAMHLVSIGRRSHARMRADLAVEREPPTRHLRIRLRVSLSGTVTSHRADLQRTRHDCTSTEWNRQDSNIQY